MIAVATLLVAVVGATFAYFTATTSSEGTDSNAANATTATVKDITLNLATASKSETYLNYPGGFGYAGVSATVNKNGDTNDYTLSYNVGIKVTNQTKTELTWTLYRSIVEPTLTDTCTVESTAGDANETRYSYKCSSGNNYGTQVETGTVGASSDADVDIKDVTKSVASSFNTSEDTNVYYYLVVNYKDTNASQNADMGKKISLSITGITDVKVQQNAGA